MEKKVAIVRFEAAPGDAPDWRARMEASHVSARQKVRNMRAVGFEAVERVLPHDIPPGEFGEILQQYNTDPSCVGLIVQLPVRQRYQDFVSLIAPHKDIDALLEKPFPLSRRRDIGGHRPGRGAIRPGQADGGSRR